MESLVAGESPRALITLFSFFLWFSATTPSFFGDGPPLRSFVVGEFPEGFTGWVDGPFDLPDLSSFFCGPPLPALAVFQIFFCSHRLSCLPQDVRRNDP